MTDREEGLEQATSLMRAHRMLAQAADPASMVSALASVCEPYGPILITLHYIHTGPGGEPEEMEAVAAWGPGLQPPASDLVGRRGSFADHPLAPALLDKPQEALIVTDLDGDPRVRATVTDLSVPIGSIILLPLFSARHTSWQGVVGLHWSGPHAPAPAERILYELLLTTLSESIAAERTLRAHRTGLVDNENLLVRAELALQESQRQRTMLRTLLDHLPLGVVVVRIIDGGKMEVVTSAGKLDLERYGEKIDLTTVVAYGPGENEPLPMDRMPAVIALKTGQTARGELELPLPDGSRILLDSIVTPMQYEGDPSIHLICLYSDVTEQRRAERDRLATQEQLLQVQALALAERSTPLIPIREDVLVLPLVGSIDDERGRQILDTLVHLGGRTTVRAAIIDVTGIRNLDTAAARVLLGAAQALRLRGVQSILTGIQANAAMTLVGLGIDFSGIAVRGTLQDGVAFATRG